MAYSKTGIMDLGLDRIGVTRIVDAGEDSVQAITVNAVWEYMLNEVLEAREWTFAKVRVALAQSSTAPVAAYTYAYPLPADFLRLCRDKRNDPSVYPSGGFASFYIQGDLQLVIPKYGYTIETLADETRCLFIDYNNDAYDLFIRYIRKLTDPGKFSATFIKALAYRIAQEVAYKLTESTTKEKSMGDKYKVALKEATALDESGDWIEDETGNTDWEYAGR